MTTHTIRRLRVLCYIQIAAVVALLVLLVRMTPLTMEWSRLVDELRPQYHKTNELIKENGITGDQRAPAAYLFEWQLDCIERQPRVYRYMSGMAFVSIILFSLLPLFVLRGLRKTTLVSPGGS